MNVLRLLGDFCHLTSIVILIYKIHSRKTTAGISLRTRVLYLLVFLSRYGDLFLYYVGLYNSFMKVLYLCTTSYIIYLMTMSAEYKNTWYHDLDNFAILPLVIASAALMLVCTARYTVFEMSWTFSIILESVAILPQIDHLTKVPTLPALPLSHLVALGMYRAFYVLHWLVRVADEGVWDFTVFFFGLVQTLIWADFLWVWYNRKQIKLPPNTEGRTSSSLRGQEEGSGSGGSGSGEGQQVDEGDMSRSFVLSHIIRLARAFEAKYMVRKTMPSLSVSAYPDQVIRPQSNLQESYADDVVPRSAAPAATATMPQAGEENGAYIIRVPDGSTTATSGPVDVSGLPASSAEQWSREIAQSEDGFSVASEEGASKDRS